MENASNYTEFHLIGDDPELKPAIAFCNKYKKAHTGVLAAASKAMTNPATNAQVSNVLSGKATYTSRNLEILSAIYTAIVKEVNKATSIRQSLTNIAA